MMENAADPILVQPAWIAENLENLSIRIVEVSDMKSPEIYFSGHIEGAVFWPWMESLWHRTSRDILPQEDFAALMEKSGITHDTTIILYSNQFQYACYAFRICMMRGHSKLKMEAGVG